MQLTPYLLPLCCLSIALAAPSLSHAQDRNLNPRGWKDSDFADQLGNSIFGKNPDYDPYEATAGGDFVPEELQEARRKAQERFDLERAGREQDEWNRNSKNRLPKEWSAGTDHVRQMYENKWKPNGKDLVKNPLDDEVNNGGGKGKDKKGKGKKGVGGKIMGALKKIGN